MSSVKSDGEVCRRPWWGMVFAGLLVVGVVSAQAGDPASATKKQRSDRPKAVAKAKPKPSSKTDQRQVVTGSQLPVKIERYGRTADTISPVYILDREDLERSGAASVGEVLRRLPFAH